MPDELSQCGALAGQCELSVAVQAAHAPLGRQRGAAPVQAVVLPAEHWPQAPEGWQAGVAPPQSASPAQARQTCAVTLHTGVVPPHWASDVQATQVPGPTSHAGVAPPQRERLL